MYDGLPDTCLTLMPSDGRLIYIECGATGYHTSEWETGDPQKTGKLQISTTKNAVSQKHRRKPC